MDDITIACVDCRAEFTFGVGEQEFFLQKGFDPPKRCPDCRAAKKRAKEGGQQYGG